MSSVLGADPDNAGPAAKRPKRTYRACYPCRSRKLKCNFGDPDKPWDGPCVRCTRERRECVRAMSTVVRYALPDVPVTHVPAPAAPAPTAFSQPSFQPSTYAPPPPPPKDFTRFQSRDHAYARYEEEVDDRQSPPLEDEGDAGRDGGRALLMSNLQNPNDALRLLASASSLRYQTGPAGERVSETDPPRGGINAWHWWAPVEEGGVGADEAAALLGFFEIRMAPLFPLIHPRVLEPAYLPTLVADEALLLGAIVGIASRYANVLEPARAAQIHAVVSQWVRAEITSLMDGDLELRSTSTVEALLLLSEWPLLPATRKRRSRDEPDSEEARLLRPSLRYDAYCWSNIGLAIRIAQELGMEDSVFQAAEAAKEASPDAWKYERPLKTWIYCYNAESHIAARLGRSAVMQPNMTSKWWESLSVVNCAIRKDKTTDAWAGDLFTLTSNGQLLGSIQQHLYWSKEITYTLLRSGAWESFMRSMRLDMRHNRHCCDQRLREGTLSSAILQLEFDYLVLYANSLALRSLQRRLRRARERDDPSWETPSLLNAVEGPWIIEALSAARAILETTTNMLEARGHLRFCPSRIFQYILFATTFLYKALAIGAVEHGESSIVAMLERTVAALGAAAIDNEHFPSGFAVLLARLGKHWHAGPNPNRTLVFGPKPPESQPGMPVPLPPIEAPVEAPVVATPPAPPLAAAAAEGGLGWQLDLTSHMPAAELEQDVIFQSIWDHAGQSAGISTSSLYATLLGEALNMPETL
ncbi:hypothetical protein CC85DRAFT_284001 [Cutaneotrichosporon oleaginosum]|uniref:Zn(2)-C6 fungal-type domain-containing protein n=1 Tax=Cutaneotrichosporon oleaginosum TaxID=879819 RepID=A0A0J0XSC0_9TREE|nr:uncharacterized protein CC85DRAFT_284001 [Cutaneotrichosporon oleaginosum]KLT43957.1 hypothetical protein CC85DRAFT_284001 [Cutaneotrichosporon oleaginosum]TXT04096.1 hypothetical protein COLE_07793 [Cutaneotrichosporon oleaginosum]